jgi:hypothetical protein
MIFWPLGVLLLVMRLARDRHASISTGRILKVVGIVVMLVFAIGGYSYYQEQQNLYGDTLGREGEFVVGLAITFTLLGFILWRFGNKLDSRGKMVGISGRDREQAFLRDRRDRPIVSKRPDKVASEIGFLIRTGYLPDAYLNEGAKRVVVPAVERHLAMEADLERRMEAQTGEARQSEAPSANHRISETPERSAVPPVPRLVTCRSCGANNIVTPGHPRECEFCGSLSRGTSRKALPRKKSFSGE